MRRFWFLLLLTLILSPQVQSQTRAQLQKAFADSYVLEASQQFTEAIAVLNKVYQADGYEINLRLGWLHYSAALHTEALKYYQRCMQLRPLSLEAKFGYVLPASMLGHWDQVLTQYQDILSVDQYHPRANFFAGQIYYNREDFDTAEKYFQKVVNLYPFDYDSLLMLAWTKFFLGRTSEAKTLFYKVLLYAPGDKSAKEGLGLIK